MDTTTVLEIIKMLETRCIKAHNAWRAERIESIIAGKEPDNNETQYLKGIADGLYFAQDHLQSFIEAQLNAAELQSGE